MIRDMVSRLIAGLALALIGLLVGCGGGGSGGASGAPTGLTYPTPPAFVVGQAITALTPTVAGTVTGYAANPALPPGLELNATSGVISGTPTAITAKAQYTVTASNSDGSTSAQLALVVNDKSPAVSYGSALYSFTTGIPAQAVTPTSAAGKVISWSISPTLPAGLTFDDTTGTISGTPTAGSAAATYTVTAVNSGGNATTTLALAVSAAPVLDVGHATTIIYTGFSGAQVLSEDSSGHWVLWNYASGAQIGSGTALIPPQIGSSSYQPTVALAGPTAVIQTATGFSLLVAATGTVEGTIATTAPAWWQIAVDGSYLCAGTASGLTVWTPGGQALLNTAGDYSKAAAFPASGQVQIAQGPAAGVIQTITVSSGAVSQSPAYQGAFQTWFVDGSAFETVVGSPDSANAATAFVYSSAGNQLEVLQLPAYTTQTGGVGSWFWAFYNFSSLAIYAVGGSTAPAATFTYPSDESALYPSGTTLGIAQAAGLLSVVDFTGATPSSTDFTLPLALNAGAFAASSSSDWITSTNSVLIDGASLSSGAPRYLNYGRVLSVAGSASDFAIATESGRTLVYAAGTHTLETTIDFSSVLLALSADGSVLAAGAEFTSLNAQNAGQQSLNIYTLPAGTLSNSLGFPIGSLGTLTASGSGTAALLGISLSYAPMQLCFEEVIPALSSTPSWCSHTAGLVEISPDGTLISSSTPGAGSDNATTNVYQNGTLSTAVSAQALGWLDNNTFLANVFDETQGSGGIALCHYANAGIYSAAGALQSSVSLPELSAIQVLSSSSIYASNPNAIFALPSGAISWTSASPNPPVNATLPGIGAVSGSEAIFPSGHYVLAESITVPSG
jgi:hypothetical protein